MLRCHDELLKNQAKEVLLVRDCPEPALKLFCPQTALRHIADLFIFSAWKVLSHPCECFVVIECKH